jgi:hypothetical protein
MDTQTQNEAVAASLKTDKRQRIGVGLTIKPSLYRRFRRRASAEHVPFASWLVRLAERELRRKPSL